MGNKLKPGKKSKITYKSETTEEQKHFTATKAIANIHEINCR